MKKLGKLPILESLRELRDDLWKFSTTRVLEKTINTILFEFDKEDVIFLDVGGHDLYKWNGFQKLKIFLRIWKTFHEIWHRLCFYRPHNKWVLREDDFWLSKPCLIDVLKTSDEDQASSRYRNFYPYG